ncbi:MAG: 4-hydroxy-3-methylbut-2-enyl diphosphate reductase [Bacteroidetes bacterium]|nr:4-hydroxy-3-methylbut-2-enyl diphosphate reductase [Bacteroidota bacterium]MBU1718275.1 4-hydroxy-3-methylbut-2-enyl diphosphate reductase [Bacteroidota bacterium]
MKVEIDPNAGFCFGVVYAISMAEEELEKSGHLFCLGDIVHNTLEVERLRGLGLEVIGHERYKSLKNCKVLIRAHGEPPGTYRIAVENNIQLIDASCPVVLKLQARIRKGSEDSDKIGGQIVIFGKEGHAEVNGLVGQTGGRAIIVESESDIEKIDFSKPVYLYSQTTKSTSEFHQLSTSIENRMVDEISHKTIFQSHDTICRQVSNRDKILMDFASSYDLVIFVSDKKSSNGKFLFQACSVANPQTYFVSSEAEIKQEWLIDAESVGISGATSTPRWLMEKIAKKLQMMKPD